mmetsp:Transcript_42958/g.108441  ORF Transcript_42958/g.108441 Transcript_42958/m.108441 type:complete len:228 (-) Transcript_42958:292-975(-)
MYLGNTAQTVAILNFATVAMTFGDLRVVEEDPDALGAHQLATMRSLMVDQRSEGGLRAKQRFGAECGAHIRHAEEVLGAEQRLGGETGDELRAVDQCQSFLGAQLARLHAVVAQHVRGGQPLLLARMPHVALAQEGQRQVSQRSEVSAGTHTALLGNLGHQAQIEGLEEVGERVWIDATAATCQYVQSQSEQHARSMHRQTFSHTAGVRANEVLLQLRELIGRDDDM